MTSIHGKCSVLCFLIGVVATGYAFESLSEENDFSVAEVVKNVTTPTGKFHPTDPNLKTGTHKWLILPHEKNDTQIPHINLFFNSLFLEENDLVTVFKSLDDSYDNGKSIIPPIRSQNGSITIITDEKMLVVKLEGNNTSFLRKFECSYHSLSCSFSIDKNYDRPTIIHSPVYIGKNGSAECRYTYNPDHNHRTIPMFLFDEFNYIQSKVSIKGSTYPLTNYDKSNPIDFFLAEKQDSLLINVEIADKNETFRLIVNMVDSTCSKYIEKTDFDDEPLKSPVYTLDNGTLGQECVWIIRHTDDKEILGVTFPKLNLANVLDVVAINDGGSAISPPLLQVTSSNVDDIKKKLIRSSGAYLWISFKPVSFTSEMVANITIHGQGGHLKGGGNIEMKPTTGNDSIFLLEVEGNNVVELEFTASNIKPPASVSIYDGFDQSHLITTLQGDIWYPILSQSSKMMMIATAFNAASFSAKFSGVLPSCVRMRTPTDQNYVLSGNCNNTCKWIIPPQNIPGSALLLNLQYFSSNKNDTIKIQQLDKEKTVIGTIDSTILHIPQITLPSNVGALVEINRKDCTDPNAVSLVGLSSYVPVCGGEVVAKPGEALHICSPLYPDTYPIYASCNWTLSAAKGNMLHFSFDKISLAPNHCLRVFNSLTNSTTQMTGSETPDDLFLSSGSSVSFLTEKCESSKTSLQLVSSEGFMLNGTVIECGAVLDKSVQGEFTVNVTSSNQSLCMWKLSVPHGDDKGSVNIIAYSVTIKDDKGNYELEIFDGASVKDPQIKNVSTTEIWSRKNNIIFLYQRLNVSKPSSVFIIKYRTISCNASLQCENKICMHPDWRCNGLNECGDNSDELHCNSTTPPETKQYGYSSTAFFTTAFVLLFLGLLVGFAVPILYEKHKDRQYHRFSDISVIE